MSDITKYVRDAAGHIYIYVPAYHSDRIGKGLEFTDRPQAAPKPKEARRSYRTLQELREAAAKVGLEIEDGTPFAKAQNIYTKFLSQRTTEAEQIGELEGIGAFDNVGKKTN